MNMNWEQPQSKQPFKMRTGLAWLVFISRIGAVSVEVFLRKNFGARYIGTQAFLVLLAIPLWTLGFPGQDCTDLMIFLAAYLGMVLFARVGILWRSIRGDGMHSYYNGTPHLERLLPFLGEMTIKKLVEPALVFAIGYFGHETSRPLGSYLMFAAGCLFCSAWIIDFSMRKRTRDLQDALIEQQIVMSQFRGPGRW